MQYLEKIVILLFIFIYFFINYIYTINTNNIHIYYIYIYKTNKNSTNKIHIVCLMSQLFVLHLSAGNTPIYSQYCIVVVLLHAIIKVTKPCIES